eukprot:gene18837-22507_t
MTAVMERTKPTTAAQAELNADATLKQSTLTTGERTFDTCAAVIEALSRRQPVRAQGSETDAATGTGAEDAERGPKQDEGDGQDSAGRCPRQANHSHRGLGIDGGCGHLHSFGSRTSPAAWGQQGRPSAHTELEVTGGPGCWEMSEVMASSHQWPKTYNKLWALVTIEALVANGKSASQRQQFINYKLVGALAAKMAPHKAACELGFLYKAEMAGTYYEVGNYVAAEPETAMSEETQKEKVAGNIVPAVPKSHTIGCVEIFAMWWEWGTPLMGLTAGVKIDNQGVIAQF